MGGDLTLGREDVPGTLILDGAGVDAYQAYLVGVRRGTLEMNGDTRIVNSFVPYGTGGAGVAVMSGSVFTMNNGTFSGNQTGAVPGGHNCCQYQ